METIKVEVFYGKYDPKDSYGGVTFYFATYQEAIEFISFVEDNSSCNALIIHSFNFSEKAGE